MNAPTIATLKAETIRTVRDEQHSDPFEIVSKGHGFDFPRWELDAAFELVKNRKHWKGTINRTAKVETGRDVHAIDAAVTFFAGCVARISLVASRPGFVRVQAIGYWAGGF